MEFKRFYKLFRRETRTLSHQRLKMLSKGISETRKSRFNEGDHGPRVELVERGFSDEEFQSFMAEVHCPVDKACFMFMATLGLRIGELVMLRGRDLEGDQIRIPTAKSGFAAILRLPVPLISILPARDRDESLFDRSHKQLRDRFSIYRKEAGLDDIYMESLPCGPKMTRNKRYRLTLHSLRHFAIQRVFKATKDPDLTRRFARHKDMKATERYLKSSRKEEVEMVLEKLVSPNISKIRN